MRPLCLFLLAALPLAASADLKKDLEARYHGLDGAIAAIDGPRAVKWMEDNATADFQYISHDKTKYDKKGFIKAIKDQIAMTKKTTTVKTKVVSLQVNGTTATVTVDSDTNVILTVDSKEMKLVDKSRCVDTWVKVGTCWLIKKSVQTAADTKMYQPG